MRKRRSAERELFILHASQAQDVRFVQTYLVPSLGLFGHQFALSSSLPPGRTFLEAIEHALSTSRVTLLIISPAFLREAWVLFGELLAIHHAIRGGVLVPLLIADCRLPWRLDLWVRLDFRRPEDRDDELVRLRALLKLPSPLPAAVPTLTAVEASEPPPEEPALPDPPPPDEPAWRLYLEVTRARAMLVTLVASLVILVRATEPGAAPSSQKNTLAAAPEILDVRLESRSSAKADLISADACSSSLLSDYRSPRILRAGFMELR